MDNTISTEILVVGGGIVGTVFACFAADAGFEVVLVDKDNPDYLSSETFDGRASALSHGTRLILEKANIWQYLADNSQPIWQIRVSDEGSNLFLHFDHNDLGNQPLGYMIENRHIRKALYSALTTRQRIRLLAPSFVTNIKRDIGLARASLDCGQNISSDLVVAADGAKSAIRTDAKIGTHTKDYHQAALVVTVEHEYSHRGIAHERFRSPGPFAILPLRENLSSLVWVESKKSGAYLFGLDKDAFNNEVARRFGSFLGKVHTKGPRWTYDLKLTHADTYFAHRLALLGDAAHTLHPLAGQNLNLSIRDAKVLTEELITAALLGRDIGITDVLSPYEARRRPDNERLVFVTGGLNSLFSNDNQYVKLVRNLGLAAVNKLPLLKRGFMRYASGTISESLMD